MKDSVKKALDEHQQKNIREEAEKIAKSITEENAQKVAQKVIQEQQRQKENEAAKLQPEEPIVVVHNQTDIENAERQGKQWIMPCKPHSPTDPVETVKKSEKKIVEKKPDNAGSFTEGA